MVWNFFFHQYMPNIKLIEYVQRAMISLYYSLFSARPPPQFSLNFFTFFPIHLSQTIQYLRSIKFYLHRQRDNKAQFVRWATAFKHLHVSFCACITELKVSALNSGCFIWYNCDHRRSIFGLSRIVHYRVVMPAVNNRSYDYERNFYNTVSALIE